MTLDALLPGTLVSVAISRWMLVAALIYVSTLPEGGRAFLWWGLSYGCIAFVVTVNLIATGLGATPGGFPLTAISSWWGVLMAAGTLVLAGRAVRWPWLAGALLLMSAWPAWAEGRLPFLWQALPSTLLASAGQIAGGVLAWRRAKPTSILEYRVIGAVLAAAGVLSVTYPFIRLNPALAAAGFLTANLFYQAMALGLVILLYRIQARRTDAAAAKVRSAELGFQELLDALPDPLVMADSQGRIAQFNGPAERQFGYTRQELLGRPIEVLVPPGVRERHPALRGSFFRNPSTRPMGSGLEMRAVRKDGTEFFCDISLSLITLPEGPLTVAAVRDMTARKQAEVAQRESNERLRMILDRAPIGIALNGADFRYTCWNPAAERILGYRAEEIIGKHPFETIVSEQDRDAVMANFERLRRGEMEAHAIRHDRAKDGRTVICEWHHTPFLDAEGHFAGKISMMLDVTERQRAEEAITESRERLATTLRSIGDAVIATDVHGRVDNMNPVAERLTGWPLVEARGRDLGEVFHIVAETSRMLAESPVQRVLREGQVVGLANHTVLIARDGTEWPIADSGAPIRGEHGRMLGVVLVFRDQTEERRAEAALRESEARIREIVETIPHGIQECDLNGVITYSNRAHTEMLGYAEGDLIGKTIWSLLAFPAEQEALRESFSHLVEQQPETRNYQGVDITKDGRLIDVQVDWDYKRNSLGRPSGFIAVITDITDRRRAEIQLRESEERYRGLIEGSAQGILIAQDGKIVFCNQEIARKVANGDIAKLLGKSGIELVVPEDREHVIAYRNALLAGEPVPVSLEYRVQGNSGEHLSVESYGNLILWNGRPAIQSTLIDITEMRQLREQLSQAQRMESVGRLAGGIAHDFNNILTVISAHIGFILDRAKDDAQLQEDATVVQDASRRAAALTRQLLAFSRRQILQMRVVSLNDVVAGLNTMLGRLIGEDIQVRISLDPALKPIRADSSQIDQVIMNLVINARDAMPRGGFVSIETSNRFLDDNYARTHMDVVPGEYAMLAIADTGTGIDSETQKRIFEPFFTTKPQGQGTGLGLATVYGIVKQMNGSIFVYSELNKGTAFKIYFPVAQDQAVEDTQRATAEPPIQPTETILLVEDDELVRRSVQRILGGAGYRVIVTTSPEEALEIARAGNQTFDLLLTDVVMPGMSGNELWDAIRQVRDVRVLFMSGYTDDTVIRHGILEGEMPFLSKPFTKQSLLDKVREVFRNAG